MISCFGQYRMIQINCFQYAANSSVGRHVPKGAVSRFYKNRKCQFFLEANSLDDFIKVKNFFFMDIQKRASDDSRFSLMVDLKYALKKFNSEKYRSAVQTVIGKLA